MYSNVSQDKVRLAEENRRLKAMMSSSTRAPGSASLPSDVDVLSNPSIGYSGSVAGSAASHGHSHPGGASSNTSVYTTPPPLPALGTPAGVGMSGMGPNPNLDYDQAGIDFVLQYDNPNPSNVKTRPQV